MPTKIKEIQVITGREMVEKERKRLLGLKRGDPRWWNSEIQSGWAREQYGKSLKEKDGFTCRDGREENCHMCQICGELPGREERFIQLSYSFCDEYSCSMNICKKCLKMLLGKLKDKVKEKK